MSTGVDVLLFIITDAGCFLVPSCSFFGSMVAIGVRLVTSQVVLALGIFSD